MSDPFLHDQFELVPCTLCGADDFAVALTTIERDSRKPIRIVRCNRCAMCYTNPRPTPSHIGDYYTSDYAPYKPDNNSRGGIRLLVDRHRHGVGGNRPRGAQAAIASLASALRRRDPHDWILTVARHPGGRALDVGSGQGKFLRRLRSLGYTVAGIDIAAESVAQLAAAGIEHFQGTIPTPTLAGRQFELVTLRATLEHVLQPVETLAAARQLLAPGGMVYVEVPNFAAWDCAYFDCYSDLLDVPRHLQHFTATTLADAFKRAGFSDVQVRQMGRENWVRKAMDHARRLKAPRPWTDALLKIGPLRRLKLWRETLRGRGNMLMAAGRV